LREYDLELTSRGHELNVPMRRDIEKTSRPFVFRVPQEHWPRVHIRMRLAVVLLLTSLDRSEDFHCPRVQCVPLLLVPPLVGLKRWAVLVEAFRPICESGYVPRSP